MKNRNLALLLLALILSISCNFPLFSAQNIIPAGTITPGLPSTTNPPSATIAAAPIGLLAEPNSGPLNCRSGPGLVWPVVIILAPGQAAEIVGRTADGSWWYVKNPTLPGNFCWVSTGFTTVKGDASGVAVVPAPPLPPTSAVPANQPGIVTSVEVSVSPNTISVGGCMGPIQPVTVYATITVNGPAQIDWHFKDQQVGDLPGHSLNFKKAASKDVSDSFTPPVNAGKFRIVLLIDGMNLKGMNSVTFYTITC
jgi:hypothetical protein